MLEHNILVVEDSPTMRQLIVFALSRLPGVSCVEAEDGVDALRQMASSRFDLMVTDINMPLMDGLKLLGRVRQDPKHREIPVVVISTEAGRADRERAMRLGANAYIIKPIRAQQVQETVKGLL